jgi:uncharacterized protein YxeA
VSYQRAFSVSELRLLCRTTRPLFKEGKEKKYLFVFRHRRKRTARLKTSSKKRFVELPPDFQRSLSPAKTSSNLPYYEL